MFTFNLQNGDRQKKRMILHLSYWNLFIFKIYFETMFSSSKDIDGVLNIYLKSDKNYNYGLEYGNWLD